MPGQVRSRREEYAEATRAAILQSATELFVAQGFAATSIDAVAEAARVSKGSVYHHFTDKAELFEAVFLVMEQSLLDHVTAQLPGAGRDPWAVMAAGIDAYLDYCTRADFGRVALQEAPVALGWPRWRAIEEQFFLGLISASLRGMAEAGLIVIPEGDMAARMLLAALSEAGLAMAAAAPKRRADQRAAAAALAQNFLRSLAAPQPAKRGSRAAEP